MPDRNIARLPILGMCVIVMMGCSSSKDAPTLTSSLDWVECSDNAQIECATLDVPRDYQQRDAGNIQLALRRKVAPIETRIGTLMVHLGGQGAAAIDVDNIVFDSSAPEVLLQEFDLVAFDPRGSGDSTPAIDCDEFAPDLNSYPATDADIQEYATDRIQFASDCFEKYGRDLQLIGSQASVRDMEEIRQALGDEKLNFFGSSWGTRMGALYLQTYPEHGGAFVLDASLSPSASIRQNAMSQLSQLQMNLEALFSDCARIDPACNPAELVIAAESRIDTLVAENAGREFELFYGILSVSAGTLDVAELTLEPLVNYLQVRDLATLENPLGALFDEFNDFAPYTAVELAVVCADEVERTGVNSLISDLDEFNQISNIFAEFGIGDLAAICIGWPEALNPLAPIATSTAPQALVIGGSTDPFTTIQGSREMAAAIGGYFIESSHSGHSVVYTGDSECVDETVTDFLRTGNPPVTTECIDP